MRGKQLWHCSLRHVLNDDGFHVVPDQERVHGRITVPVDYEPPEREIQTVKHEVSVVHSHKPRPRPNQLSFIIRDAFTGQDFRTAPISVYGQRLQPVHFPLIWATGRKEDLALPEDYRRILVSGR
jgi:hypothetical protein